MIRREAKKQREKFRACVAPRATKESRQARRAEQGPVRISQIESGPDQVTLGSWRDIAEIAML
jgi:hypothetical protein